MERDSNETVWTVTALGDAPVVVHGYSGLFDPAGSAVGTGGSCLGAASPAGPLQLTVPKGAFVTLIATPVLGVAEGSYAVEVTAQ